MVTEKTIEDVLFSEDSNPAEKAIVQTVLTLQQLVLDLESFRSKLGSDGLTELFMAMSARCVNTGQLVVISHMLDACKKYVEAMGAESESSRMVIALGAALEINYDKLREDISKDGDFIAELLKKTLDEDMLSRLGEIKEYVERMKAMKKEINKSGPTSVN